MDTTRLLQDLDVDLERYTGGDLASFSPINGQKIASIGVDTEKSYTQKLQKSVDSFHAWRDVPAPQRGEMIGMFGQELRRIKASLGELVTIECGKSLVEGLGEVQEMIDICDFAVGLSRQVGGLTLPSERQDHVMHENWLPLGVVGVISAFNFPVAVWAWNFALAIICGDSVVWKPSEKTPLCAIACHSAFERAAQQFAKGDDTVRNLSQVVIGDASFGKMMAKDEKIALVSATGSCTMGRSVAKSVADRFGKSLLELGGNNAAIVAPSADLDTAISSVFFGAIGTAGQRCTSTRRLILHESRYDEFCQKIKKYYSNVDNIIGNPLDEGILLGPLIDKVAFDNMQASLSSAREQGGDVLGGSRVLEQKYPDAYYVSPALVTSDKRLDVSYSETFAPILYITKYVDLADAIAEQNDAHQGLSSAIFTSDLREAELFKRYSDCGIANVNIGTSGAEIGGAFGGEKETGGGRESGSDAWKGYMRRQTSTTYFGTGAPQLAQGIKFSFGS